VLTYNGQFEQELMKLVNQEIDNRLNDLANVVAITDHATYSHRAGIIQGLRMVADLCEEAGTVLSER